MGWLDRIDRNKLALAGLALGLILFFAVNIYSNATFSSAKLDLTQGRLFTLSQGTRNVLKGIDEPITFRLYYTKLMGERSPAHANLFERVQELLGRYADISKGRIRVEVLHPEPFSDVEDRAVAGGLQGVPLNNAGDLGYFGLTGSNSTDDQVVIPFFTTEREAFLEYDLTKVVYTLANPARKVVGVMSTLPIDGGGSPTRMPFNQSPRWAVMDQVNEFFQIRPVPTSYTEIPKDIDILMIVHPKGLRDATLYAIDQYVLAGGRALVFVDSNAEVDGLGDPQAASPRSEFDNMLEAWGVRLMGNKIAGDLDAARRVNVRVQGKVTVADYVAWLTLSERNFDAADVVTSDINAINMATAGILEKTGAEGPTVTPLIHTGPRAMAIAAEKVAGNPDVVGMFREFTPGGKALMLAARITGKIKSAFPDGPPEDARKAAENKSGGQPPATPAAAPLKEAAKPANIIVVADVDMLHDRFWTEARELLGQRLLVPFANNADFVVNALDNLTGSDAMIGLRGRSQSTRPFHMVQNSNSGPRNATCRRSWRTCRRTWNDWKSGAGRTATWSSAPRTGPPSTSCGAR
jgi:ABC-type uncharacterized transport system involved in gliding motility auxiliary subunit